jgi:hypothetical protein
VRLADGIRERGFRGWYQRELTRGHGGLVVVILAAFAVLVMAERASQPGPMSDRLGALVVLLACAAVGALALRRYFEAMLRAEHVARQAVCHACQTYGRLAVVRDQPARESLEVACSRCGAHWEINDPG